jgi:phosphocarrier protein FPr
MVGLVLVSHSHTLALAARELALQVNEGMKLPISACGGVGDNHEELGTDATEIIEAIEAVSSDDGILLLMDLGSAILSAETALEFFGDGVPIRLCPAPLVEGAVAAAVQISMGNPLETVYEEALQALDPKREQLLGVESAATTAPDEPASKEGERKNELAECRFTINTPHGLHARPAAQFVRAVAASGVAAEVAHADHPDRWVNAKSLNRVATLNVRSGNQIILRAPVGNETRDLFSRIKMLVANNFGEQIVPQGKAVTEEKISPLSGEFTNQGLRIVSGGVAVAPVYRLQKHMPEIPKEPVRDIDLEISKLHRALEAVETEIKNAQQEMENRGKHSEAAVFEAHLLILQDPELQDSMEKQIRTRSSNAMQAAFLATEEIADQYRSLEDPYMRVRADDVKDVALRLLLALEGKPATRQIRLAEPSIIVAEKLDPSEILAFSPDMIKGIVTRRGDVTSHAAILARSLGVPAVTDYQELDALVHGAVAIIDTGRSLVIPNPDKEQLLKYRALEEKWRDEMRASKSAAQCPGATRDGKLIPVYANIGRSEEVEMVIDSGAEGIGLYRTEFLFLHRDSAPTEEDQFKSFTSVIDRFGKKPIILRLLDIGGDKQIPFIELPREDNPFLGVRGVRLYPSIPTLFSSHLRAVLRAAVKGTLQIMIPMVTRPDEVNEIRSRFYEFHEQLTDTGVEHAWPVKIGIMVETPAAVEMSRELARVSDFFSIGTNDLTQYIMAADRGNAGVEYLSDAFDPAVLRAIRRTVQNAAKQDIPCGVCGELAGDPCGALLLAGLGVTSLSASGAAIPRIKAVLRLVSSSELGALAESSLAAENSRQVHERCRSLLKKSGAERFL